MAHFWSWVGRHSRALALGSAAAALVLLAGGIALGVHQTPTQLNAAVGPGGGRAIPVVAEVSASRHSVSGVIVALGDGRALVRNANGSFFGLVLAPGAHIRANGKAIPANSLKVGDRILAIGTRSDTGALRALYVTVTGRVVLPPGFRAPVPGQPGRVSPTRTPTSTSE